MYSRVEGLDPLNKMRMPIAKVQEKFRFFQFYFKPGLHIVGRIAEHAWDDASKSILKLSTYRLKIFLVKHQNL